MNIGDLWQDVRHGARILRLNPGFACVAIASLGLGIGANAAIFQLLDAVGLRSLPVQNPQQLAEIRIVGGNKGFGLVNGAYSELTRPLWEQLRDHHEGFSGVFAWKPDAFRVGTGESARRRQGLNVSGEFFTVLGVLPYRGRLLLPVDEANACPATRAIVSYAYWQSQMGGRELSSASKLMLDGHLVEVIGVTPPEFFGLAVGESFEIAIPFCRPKEMRRDQFELSVIGRLQGGWKLPQATARLDASSPGIFEATAPAGYAAKSIERYKESRLAAYPAAQGVSWLRQSYQSSLWLLLAITGMVLLIACANLASLMLARASTREREIAVRLALGASRVRLIRQLLVESALLAGLGAAAGLVLAQGLSRILVWSISSENDAVHLAVGLDWRVLLFAAAVTAVTCVVFGAVPALRASAIDPGTAMKAGGRGMTGSRERFSLQRLIVVTQISLSTMLLVGALLFVRSFWNLVRFDPGMREAGITIAFIGFEDNHIVPERRSECRRTLWSEIRAVPGVLDCATTTNPPLVGGSWTHGIQVGATEGSSKFTWVSPTYFQTMGIPLLGGREFKDSDTASSPRVAIVNKAFARQFAAGASPIGKTLRTSPEPQYPETIYEIVGVIPDTQYNNLRDSIPAMAFAPDSQLPDPQAYTAIMIHSDLNPLMVMNMVKHTLAGNHPNMIMELRDFQGMVRGGLLRERLMAMLAGFFGLLAAVLATIGLYGVIAYMVSKRRNEIGVRVALGAGRTQIVAMVMREAGRMLLIGVTVGTAMALAAGRGIRSVLFGLEPYDPWTLFIAAGLLAAIAAIASFLPARRASMLDPMAALRSE